MSKGRMTRAFRWSLIALCSASLFLVSCCGRQPEAERRHHTHEGFRNSDAEESTGFLDFLKWRWERLHKDIPPPEAYDFPLSENDPEFLQSNETCTTLTWIGHATVLIQVDGKNILTDPHFSERASPVQWAGPKRAVPPGISLHELPVIHMVLISHDHYDSLDKESIRMLRARRGGDHTVFFVPLGLKGWFEHLGVQNVMELDWWDRQERIGLEVVAVPLRHWSKRSLFSRNETLWAGWAVLSPRFRFLFVGDSGYGAMFQSIGEALGPFDLAAIPIGAYEPRWFMRTHHMNPEEAVQVHLDVRSRKSLAIHWGTFVLTDEPLDRPPEELEEAKKRAGIADEAFVVLKHGETMVLE